MNITEIENLSENDVLQLCEEKMDFKGFNIYFVDLGQYFEYSVMVFKNNHQIKYANDYALHHSGKTKEELKSWYLSTLPNKLFTEEEIAEPLKSADDYRMKRDFLLNHYGCQMDHISHFHIFHTEEERQELLRQTKNMFDNPVALAWFYDKDFVDKHVKLWETLMDREKHAMESFDYCKSAFLYEMYNHEYGINWQADWDVLSCFTNIAYKDESTSAYLARTDFTDMQKKAYLAAKSEYYEETKEW